MEILKKTLELDTIEYYATHLSIVNCMLSEKLTPMEIEVLANFMSLEGNAFVYRFGKTGKKEIMKRLKLSPSGMSNYMKSLLGKKFLREEGDIIKVWSIIEPEYSKQQYHLTLQRKENENTGT